ncbi:MAG TPA: hypothetical protein VK879_19245 [Candidatus Sulfomarinibacteraceae bacterium]|nr:hypothetical protein [Candidatus Sulfomarinibacteraceae bacterium]
MIFGRASRLLTCQQLFRRVLLALGIGLVLNLVAWDVAFLFLPEGLLRGKMLGWNLLPVETSGLLLTYAQILLFNLFLTGGLVLIANLFRVGDLPRGYLYAWGAWALYGLLLGTDSLIMEQGAKQAPSLMGLVRSSGFYEISAYTIMAAATVNLFLFRQPSWLNWRVRKVRERQELALNRREMVGIVVAVFSLLLVNLYAALVMAGWLW